MLHGAAHLIQVSEPWCGGDGPAGGLLDNTRAGQKEGGRQAGDGYQEHAQDQLPLTAGQPHPWHRGAGAP